jgi:hypothetical protein
VGSSGALISEQSTLALSCVFESLTGSFSELEPFVAGGAVDPTPVESFPVGARCSIVGEALSPKPLATIPKVFGLTNFDPELGISCESSWLSWPHPSRYPLS